VVLFWVVGALGRERRGKAIGYTGTSEFDYLWVVCEGAEEAGVQVDVWEGLVPGDRVGEA
jgi:hypothetical protein